jgi:prophage regulatory protein
MNLCRISSPRSGRAPNTLAARLDDASRVSNLTFILLSKIMARTGRDPSNTAASGSTLIEPMYLDKFAAAAFLSLSVSTFEKLLREDASFPRPRAISQHRNGYLLSELRQWGQTRPTAQRLPPPNTAGRIGGGIRTASPVAPNAH